MKKTSVTFNLSTDLKEQAVARGKERDLDLTGYLKYLIVEDLERKKRGK